MDIRIKKYIQYKIRTLSDRRRELNNLQRRREELRRDVIDESPLPQDGQPRGKGGTSNPVENKVLKLEKIDKRIGVLDAELKKYEEIEQKIRLMGRIPYEIYRQSIAKEINAEYLAMELGMCERSLYTTKSKLLEFIATELGEYIDMNEIEK